MVGLAGLLPGTWLMHIAGDKAKDILSGSRLPSAELYQIWFVICDKRHLNEANYREGSSLILPTLDNYSSRNLRWLCIYVTSDARESLYR